MPPGIDNFNPFWKSHHIVVPKLASVLPKPSKTIGHCRSKWLELYFCLLLSESPSSQSQWYPFWNSDIPKKKLKDETNGENYDEKACMCKFGWRKCGQPKTRPARPLVTAMNKVMPSREEPDMNDTDTSNASTRHNKHWPDQRQGVKDPRIKDQRTMDPRT